MSACSISIIDSVDAKLLDNLSSVSDRYYEHKYCDKLPEIDGNVNHRISFHSNRICMLSLGENHPIIKQGKVIRKIDYQVEGGTDRLKNSASGKGKKGAQKLKPNSVICRLECEDNSNYLVYSCVTGKLIEMNENLLENPNLLVSKPVSEGFIALILPFLPIFNDLKSSLISKEEYFCKEM